MGAEQSGDAEHKHAELNSSGECGIFMSSYIFLLHYCPISHSYSYFRYICVCIYRYFPLERTFIHVCIDGSFCRVCFSLLIEVTWNYLGSVFILVMFFLQQHHLQRGRRRRWMILLSSPRVHNQCEISRMIRMS